VTRKLVLFDIDGTLLTSGGAGERALRIAFRERFGIDDDLKNVEIAGRTDSGIARRMLASHGLPGTPENISAFLEAYTQHLALELPRTPGRLLPGILPLLEALGGDDQFVLGLLTGNLRRGAELKLLQYGIWQFFEFGAFADDHHDRNELGRFACDRASERHGCEFAAECVYVIGDTPHDISCAQAIKAGAIGVATGRFTRGELAGAGADVVFDDFFELDPVLESLR
jgi:phosphoglycolate phosphatase-like HAD superfamily hydrolase